MIRGTKIDEVFFASNLSGLDFRLDLNTRNPDITVNTGTVARKTAYEKNAFIKSKKEEPSSPIG